MCVDEGRKEGGEKREDLSHVIPVHVNAYIILFKYSVYANIYCNTVGETSGECAGTTSDTRLVVDLYR